MYTLHILTSIPQQTCKYTIYAIWKKHTNRTTVLRKRHKKVLHNITVHVISEGTTAATLNGNSEKPEYKKKSNNKNKKGIPPYSMVQSPSWEANWFAASQGFSRISRNPKVQDHTHKRPPPVSILGQHNPVHIPTSHLLAIQPNIIHPSMPRSPQWSPSLRFPHQDPIHPPLLTRKAILI